ncbi:MAG: AsmA family protein [Alphaproteobacteria bacterium]|nr:AsmA family protein [Alphaproteobacteria bacterium]
MKKFLLFVFVFLLLIIGGAVFYVMYNMEDLVKNAVNKYGSQVTGTEVRLGGFQLSPFDGWAKMRNLTVANPKGYAQANIISLGDVEVKLNIKSLLDPTIIVEKVVVNKPEVTYELSNISRNNISDLLNNINQNTSSTKKAEQENKSDAGKKVVVDVLNVVEGKVNVAASVAGQGAAVGLPLPKIEMKNIGRDNTAQGQTIVDTLTIVLKKILLVSYDTVIKSGFSGLKDIADETVKQVGDKAGEAKEGIGGFIKNLFN